MEAQVIYLREVAQRFQVEVRVLTWAAGAHAAMQGAFTLLRYEDPDDPTVVQVETAVGNAYCELPDQVARYGRIFEAVYRRAVPLEEYLS
jgi:hypothetical protein